MRFSFALLALLAFLAFLFFFSAFVQREAAPAQTQIDFAASEPNENSPPPPPNVDNMISIQAVFSNGTPASKVPLALLARADKTETIYRTITDSSGKFMISLQNGSYQVDALIDFLTTPGVDFASTGEISVPNERSLTLIFHPSGSLYGQITHMQAPVSAALVKVSCPSPSFDYSRINGGAHVQSDESGVFLFRALPIGSCMISAHNSDLAGSSEITILPGNVTNAIVDIQKKPRQSDFTILLLLFAIIAFTLIWYLFFRKKPPLSQSKPSSSAKEGSPQAAKADLQTATEEEKLNASNPKVRAVLATLSEREREIVLFLLKSGGRAKRSQIQHKLLIPKTSLLRNLRSLERKNIVKLMPFGRNLLAEINQSLFK